jgi:protein-tyrosine-phosphatase
MEGDVAGPRDRLGIVFVCTGNRARSPLAESLFRRAAEGIAVDVSSYGTLDVGPLPPLEQAVAEGRRLGVDLTGHRARAIGVNGLSSASLVLGFEQHHVSTAVIDGQADRSRTFLFSEFVALAEAEPGSNAGLDRARRVIASAHARRRPGFAGDYAEVTDPLGLPDAAMTSIATEIDALVIRLAVALFGPSERGLDASLP